MTQPGLSFHTGGVSGKRKELVDTPELTASIERLCDEVKVLRDCLDELHDTFKWAVYNGRLAVESEPTTPLRSDLPACVGETPADAPTPVAKCPTPQSAPGRLF
ncbi:MAG: hypothetical protein R3C53_19070 [Pirellulaceae bacterium]